MRIALAQMNSTVGDFHGNLLKMREFYTRAAALGAELVLFPELCLCGYPPADLLEKESFLRRGEAALVEVAAWTAGADSPAILCGAAVRGDAGASKRARNVAVLCAGGAQTFTQTKMLLPFYDVFDEQRYFEAATVQGLTMVGGRPVAITVCEDAWNDKGFWPRQRYTVDPVEELMQQWATLPPHLAGERVILNISASPFWHGKPAVRLEMIRALAVRHRAVVVLCNQVGANDSLIFDGSSLAVGADGAVLAMGAAFAEDLVVVETAAERGQASGLLGGGYGGAEAPPQHSDSVPLVTGEEGISQGGADATAMTWEALVLGTRDYVRKCGFTKALVGLSGGIDSALVAAIAVEALGAANVEGVGMPSEFSSEGSVSDAEQLAKNLGIAFAVLPIRGVYEGMMGVLAEQFAGTAFGLAEENLQPRIRGALLMAISNKQGGLVLTTGNKSEMAVGYCTLYGDMVGALAVLGDVYKTEVYALSRYANRGGALIPESTLRKPPSAELRPGQKDTDSLPPYDVLDPILRRYVEDYCGAEEIAAAEQVDVALVRSVLKLVERSEYKRQQAAPVLKVSKKSFGSGRRFPIAVKTEV